MPVLFEAGMACGASDLMKTTVVIAEEAAARNPGVATLTGLAVYLRGLFSNDLPMVAESVEILRRCPRLGIRAVGTENYGLMLLRAGERQLGLDRLDAAWGDYDQMGALGRRATVQRAMRQAGARRTKWSNNNVRSAVKPLGSRTPSGVSDRRWPHRQVGRQRPRYFVNTAGTHTRSVYAEVRRTVARAADQCVATGANSTELHVTEFCSG
jgi:hypothetical protein